MSKILIDGRFVGVGDSQTRYVLELVKGLVKIDNENSYTLLIRPAGEKEINRYPEIVEAPNLKIDILDIPHYTLAEQTKLLSYLKKERYDLVHFTQFNHPILYRGKFVTTIQDLTLVGHLHYHNFFRQFAYNMVMRDAANRSQKVISISDTTMADVIDYFATPKESFSVVYHGIDHDRFTSAVKDNVAGIDKFKAKYKIVGDYILYTGMWKKHKNLIRLFQAFEKFQNENKRADIKLVLTGKIDHKEPEVIAEMKRVNKALNSQLQVSDSIITTGFIDEDELPIAYAGALAYAIPSLSEGFGWPPLEAMACGTPVIASKESCIPEILGEAAYYFDPYNIDDMAAAIGVIVANENLQRELSNKGLEQVQKYNWNETAAKTLAVYREVLGL